MPELTWETPPATCPACGARLTKQEEGFATYNCGVEIYDASELGDWRLWWGKCNAAFHTAVQLRAERDAATARADALAAEVAALKGLLGRYQRNGYRGPLICEACHGSALHGHNPGCEITAALAAQPPASEPGGGGGEETR